MKSALLQAAIANLAINPLMMHMRNVAYFPVTLPTERKDDEERLKQAEEKRLRRRLRNIKNESNKHLSTTLSN